MFLGLDLGTSGLRALLVNDTGTPVASATADYDLAHPHPGWSEQDPAAWITALQTTLADLRASHASEMGALKGLSFSGHMHGAVTLDADGHVLRPCILWNDTRAHAEAATLDATPGVREASGNIVFPGFTAPKLLWMRANEPELFARIATVMLPKDYLAFWLTGRRVCDMSDAAGSSWLNIQTRAWDPLLLEAGGLDPAQMPDLLEGSDVVGTLLPARAQDLGLPADVKVIAGGADNAVAACGVGALKEGQAFVSLGTSGVLLAARDTCAPDPASAVHTFCHAVPGRWYQMGVNLAATDCMNWLSRLTGKSPEALDAEAGTTLRAPETLRFYPYLSGERTPHNDSAIRGGFTGLDIATDAGQMTRAIMQGVAFNLRDSLEALRATGARIDSALAIGGGTRSDLWTQILATTLGISLDRPAQGDFGAALGAARLAFCGATDADPEAIMTRPPVANTTHPNDDLVPGYEAAYRQFVAGYPKLKDMQ